MTAGHIAGAILIVGAISGLGIYLEGRLRNARATRRAERRRHEERGRQRSKHK